MDGLIQEINDHLIAVSPAGRWSVVNADGHVISTRDQKDGAVRVAQDQSQGSIRN